MSRINRHLLAAILFVLPLTASAYSFKIDEFYVFKNGSMIFVDDFHDGDPPPSAWNLVTATYVPDAYFMIGSMGPEVNDGFTTKLTIDSAGADLTTGAGGQLFNTQLARLTTNINPATPDLGLRADDIFSVNAIFDLSLPAVPLEAYGIRLTDAASGVTPDDIVELMVIRDLSNALQVQYRHLDFVAGTSMLIDSIGLETGHEQIILSLFKADANSDAISAQFNYVDQGNAGVTNVFDNTFNIFSNEDYTRGEFIARTPVPEPSNLALMCAGLGLLGLLVRHRRTA